METGFGISLKSTHYEDALASKKDVDFFEVHSENYMVAGGPDLHQLEKIREMYPISLHGVSLSLGSAEPPNQAHLVKLKRLVDHLEPCLVSEHVSWSRLAHHYLNDLLPLPYTTESLDILCQNIQITQDFLARPLLMENPSGYIKFKHNDWTEPEFLNALAQRTGCGLLLDVNNIFVSGSNNGFDPEAYLGKINFDFVGEIHLAGHIIEQKDHHSFRIDTHDQEVCEEVWDLYEKAVAIGGPCPTLLERDGHVPALDVMIQELSSAKEITNRVSETHAAA